jgi:hypothetical protein
VAQLIVSVLPVLYGKSKQLTGGNLEKEHNQFCLEDLGNCELPPRPFTKLAAGQAATIETDPTQVATGRKFTLHLDPPPP